VSDVVSLAMQFIPLHNRVSASATDGDVNLADRMRANGVRAGHPSGRDTKIGFEQLRDSFSHLRGHSLADWSFSGQGGSIHSQHGCFGFSGVRDHGPSHGS
jgi:hypothetical protein